MSINTTFERNDFWTILFQLEELKNPVKLSDFLETNGLTKDSFFIFLEKANSYGLSLNIDENQGENFILSPLLWHKDFGDVLLEANEYRELAKDFQIAVEGGRVIRCIFLDNSIMDILPWRVLFMNESIGIIGEDTESKKILSIELNQIKDIEIQDDAYTSMYARLEIEEFIHAMRVVEGSDERLILKINHGKSITLPSNLMFLGHPYTTTNQYGDIIWAASVERSIYLMEWLYSNRDNIEILDPSTIIEEFHNFCTTNKKAA